MSGHRLVFHLRGLAGDRLLLTSRGAPPEPGAEPLSAGEARMHLGPWLAEPASRAILLEAYAAFVGWLGIEPRSDREIVELVGPRLAAELERGDAVVFALVESNAPGIPLPKPIPHVPAPHPSTPPQPTPSRNRHVSDEKVWIGILLVDQDKNPVPRRRYRIVLPNNETRDGTLGPKGEARLDGIEPGMCEVFCPYFEPVAEQTYVVKDGEHLAEIAARFGYEDDQTIWMDPANAALRELRPNPYVLAAGDELHLPAAEPVQESKPTGANHTFTLTTTPLKLKLVLETFRSRPIASDAMTEEPAPLAAPDATGGDGDIELTIARSSRFFSFAIDGHEGELHVGRLDPITEGAGVNARLVNMGYLHGTPEEADGDELALAIEEFQADAQIDVTGTIDDATRRELVVMHGS